LIKKSLGKKQFVFIFSVGNIKVIYRNELSRLWRKNTVFAKRDISSLAVKGLTLQNKISDFSVSKSLIEKEC